MTQNTTSGRLVVNLDPRLKRRLYGQLSLSGYTFKEWLTREAERFCLASMEGGELSTVTAHGGQEEKSEGGCRTQKNRGSAAGKKHKVVSLFCGCGGMDLGFRGGFKIFGKNYQRLPFEVIWANDINPEACNTYRHNLGGEVHCGDIWQMMEKLPASADVVIGGFPCQDISVNGKRAGVNGPRSGLYRAMAEVIRATKPKVFVAENVKALANHKAWFEQVVHDFRALGYNVDSQVYRAADYGVPQTRERIVFVGTAKGITPFTPPLPERNAASWMTAKEAIGDLERLPETPELSHIWSRAHKSPEQGNRRLSANRPGYTIRAECHGNIQFHYSLPRRISMREAARIQAFPDSFLFRSGLRETERQVGNAVPPVFAWHIAQAVLQCL